MNITERPSFVPSSSSVFPSGAQRGQPTSAPRPSIVMRRSGVPSAVGRSHTSSDISRCEWKAIQRPLGDHAMPWSSDGERATMVDGAAAGSASPRSIAPTSWAMSG